MWVNFNLNPKDKIVGDCTVRAIAHNMDKSWEDIYMDLTMMGYRMKDMPSSNAVWGRYLDENGYRKGLPKENCPTCYTIKDFCIEHPTGSYVLGTGTHVVSVIDGSYFDTWDCGDEIPVIFWRKGSNN